MQSHSPNTRPTLSELEEGNLDIKTKLTFAGGDAVVGGVVFRVQLGERQVDDGASVARAGQGGLAHGGVGRHGYGMIGV